MDKVTLKNGVTVKRHFYNKTHYNIDRENKIVELTPEMKTILLNKRLFNFGLGYKKIGGSSLGDLLGSNTFGSKFCESARIMWLGLPMYDEKYVKAGQAIEPKIVSLMEKLTGKKIETFDAEEYNYDYFKDETHIGGLPDAAIKSDKKLYEIKTTGEKNLAKWDKYGVPEYYRQQVCMYDYLMFGRNFAGEERETTIVACFLKPEDYADPESVNLKNRVVKTYKVKYTKAEVMSWINTAGDFRNQIMKSGKSIQYDENNKKDMELLEYLECTSKQEWINLLKRQGLL